MKHLIISPKTNESLELLISLAKQLKMKTRVLDGDEAEDFAFGFAIKEGRKTKLVSKKKVLKALNG